jgi:hypothetical protein
LSLAEALIELQTLRRSLATPTVSIRRDGIAFK